MNVIEALQRAMRAHSAGNLVQAEQLYNVVLAADRQQFDALHMLGIVQCQRGNFGEAVGLFTRALKVRPRSADAHANLGRAQIELGLPEQAAASYQQALVDQSEFRGGAEQLQHHPAQNRTAADALAQCDKALALQPDYPNALNNRANALFDLERYEESAGSLR